MNPLIPLIGLGLTTATSIGTSIFNATREEPDIPGASGAQKLGLALTQGRANQLASGQGLSETEYNRPLEAARRQVAGASAQGMEQTRSASPFMSNVAAERIAHEFASKGGEILTETRKELTSMDIRAARENLKLSLQAQQMANQQANEIAEIERRKKAQEEAWRNQKLMGIVSAAGSAATSMMKLVEMGEAIKPTPETPSAVTVENSGAMSIGNMGVPSMLPPTAETSKKAEIQFGGGFLPFDVFTSTNKPTPMETVLSGYQQTPMEIALSGYKPSIYDEWLSGLDYSLTGVSPSGGTPF